MAEALVVTAQDSAFADYSLRLRALAESHPCSRHPLFQVLEEIELSKPQSAAVLRNYDVHASVLRRLLLRAASMMPEAAVPYVLENVRNEYGNGNYELNHQGQLRSLAFESGVGEEQFMTAPVEAGVRSFIKEALRFYRPRLRGVGGLMPAAVCAGAITATELLAVKEFAAMQKAFARLGLQHHIWFHHVDIEVEHSAESVGLALFFAGRYACGKESVEYGLKGVLDANIMLYDGLLAAVSRNS